MGHLANAAHIFSLSVLANWAALGLISQALRMQTGSKSMHDNQGLSHVTAPPPPSLPSTSPPRKRARANDNDNDHQGDEEETGGGGGGGGGVKTEILITSKAATLIPPTSLTKINVFPEGIELIFSSPFHRQSMSFLVYARAHNSVILNQDQRSTGTMSRSKEIVTTAASSIAKLVGDAVCLGPFEPNFLTDLTRFAATAFEGLKGGGV